MNNQAAPEPMVVSSEEIDRKLEDALVEVSRYLNFSEITPFASDMRLQMGRRPFININTRWMPHPNLPDVMQYEALQKFQAAAIYLDDETDAKNDRATDFSFGVHFEKAEKSEKGETAPGYRFRGHLSQNHRGAAIDIRILEESIKPLIDLGFPEGLGRLLIRQKSGMILVGGQTGAGKSTTLAGLAREFWEKNPGSHIYTLEDPVEYLLENENCVYTQKHLKYHFSSWAEGIFMAKREKPNLIIVGELRSPEAIQAAIEAAGTGHLVMASIHADRIPRVLDAIIDAHAGGNIDHLSKKLRQLLRGVICQYLLPGEPANGNTYGRPILAYEVLVNDMDSIGAAIEKRDWIQLMANHPHSASRSIIKRVDELKQKNSITSETAERFLDQIGENKKSN